MKFFRNLILALSAVVLITSYAPAQSRQIIENAGAYSVTVHYNASDVVSSGGSYYMSLVGGNVGNTPASSHSDWGLLGSSSGGGALGVSPQGGTLPVQEYINTAQPALAYWNAAFHNCANQIVRVKVTSTSLGVVDSTIVNPPAPSVISATFGSRYADRLRMQLQNICPSHGTGRVPLTWGVNVSPLSLNNDYFPAVSTTGTWAVDSAIGHYVVNGTGGSPAGITIKTTSAMSIPFVAGQAFDHLVLYAATGPGLNPWTMIVDGKSIGTCGGSSTSLVAVVCSSSAVTLGIHSASVSCSASPCELAEVEGSAGTVGISVDNLSEGSCPVECFFGLSATQTAWDDITPGGYALDILWQINNEPGWGYTPTQFQTNTLGLIAHERAWSYPPSILQVVSLANPQDTTGGAPVTFGPYTEESYVPVVYAIAQSQNTEYINLRDTWGNTPVAMLLGPDGTHMSDMGNGVAYSELVRKIIDMPSYRTSSRDHP
jgi:hypothetical protein